MDKVGFKTVDESIATLRMALNCKLEAHLVESLISLFNSGVLEHRVTSPRMKFREQNTKMTIEQSSSVHFAGREKMIEMERKISELEEENKWLRLGLNLTHSKEW